VFCVFVLCVCLFVCLRRIVCFCLCEFALCVFVSMCLCVRVKLFVTCVVGVFCASADPPYHLFAADFYHLN